VDFWDVTAARMTGRAQQRGEYTSASRMGLPQGATTGEEEAEGVRMSDFF
jgi:hypothetical protein